jgi:hypothetical protein
MNISVQFFFGLLIGILIGIVSLYSVVAYSQIGILQTQVGDLQNQLTQLKSETTQLNNTLTTLNATLNSTPNPSPSLNPNGSAALTHEELHFTNVSVNKTGPGAYSLSLQLENFGTTPITLDSTKVVVNGYLVTISRVGATITWGNSPGYSTETLSSGQSDDKTIMTLKSGTGESAIVYDSGMSVEIVLVSENGSQFSKIVILP